MLKNRFFFKWKFWYQKIKTIIVEIIKYTWIDDNIYIIHIYIYIYIYIFIYIYIYLFIQFKNKACCKNNKLIYQIIIKSILHIWLIILFN